LGLFRRNKNEGSEVGKAMASGLAQAENSRPQSSADALAQELGINPYLLRDEDTLGLIRSLAFSRDSSGEVIVNPNFAALAISSSYLVRASKIDAVDAEILLRKTRVVFRHATMKMSEAEYESGAALICEAIYNHIITPNILSGINGFMSKLMKVSPKTMSISYREDKGGKAQGEF